MTTAYITHPSSRLHDTGPIHPECAARLPAIEEQLITDGIIDFLNHIQAPKATKEQLLRVHSKSHLSRIYSSAPDSGSIQLDSDTVMCPDSLEAALYSAGAAVHATELVFQKDIDDAFCCTRPPGHHATRDTAMGFCLFNNIAVAAAHALDKLKLKRVAIFDFDVHHGNGTEDIFLDDERVMFCSTYQRFLYPGIDGKQVPGRMVSVGLQPGDGSSEFRAAVEEQWMPAVDTFKPEMIFISAGFDAHVDDDIAQLNFIDDDYAWVTNMLVDAADRHSQHRIVSCLEGGYELPSLARAAAMHIKTLIGP